MMNFLKRRHSHSFLRRCPSVTQVQESECGPASLGMLLAYYKCYVLLPHLSEECKVTRDGTHVLKLLSIAKQYGLKTIDILVELGRRRMVGGQEDMIVDVALDLLSEQKKNG